jgi:hypothetical protein
MEKRLHALRSSCDRLKRFLTNEPTLTECLNYFVLGHEEPPKTVEFSEGERKKDSPRIAAAANVIITALHTNAAQLW